MIGSAHPVRTYQPQTLPIPPPPVSSVSRTQGCAKTCCLFCRYISPLPLWRRPCRNLEVCYLTHALTPFTITLEHFELSAFHDFCRGHSAKANEYTLSGKS